MDENTAIALVVIGPTALLIAGLLTPLVLRARDRSQLYELLKHSHDHGHPIPPELIAQVTTGPVPTAEKDVRRGSALLAVAVGLLIPLILFGRTGTPTGVLLAASMVICVFGCLGATFLALGLLRRPSKN